MHDRQGAPVRIGRVIVRPDGTREELPDLVDAAHEDMAGTLPRFRDLDEQGNPILFPATDDLDDDPYADRDESG